MFDARGDVMTIVMGLDQHRAQITVEWLDTETGEVSRGRVVPAHRESVRRFLERFRGEELEAALGAMIGWRFLVEELRRAGAGAHLAEPAQTSALRGNKKRAKNDRADARHLREVLQSGRLPESWIGPDHILDLRARVRLRRRSRRVAAANAGCALSPRGAQASRPAHAREPRLAPRSCRCRPRDGSRSLSGSR